MKAKSVFISALIFLVISCGKKDGGQGSDIIPSDLKVNAVVSTDNSGNVSFSATGTNIAVYIFDMGNGVNSVTSTSGSLSYKYSSSGVYTVLVTGKSSTGKTISQSIQITVTVVLSLVWSDEFDTPGSPDASKWSFETGTGSNGWGNNELEYYTNRTDNALIAGGVLKITAKREAYSGSAFTSARLITKGKFSWKYGRMEVMAKLPEGIGTWPAIWMLGDNIGTAGWPACGEVDVMEHVGKQLNVIHGTLHHPGHSGATGDGSTVTIQNVTTAFHKYAVEWDQTTIRFLVDGVPFYSFTNGNTLPFNQNFFLILNVAMGGNFAGPVDPLFSNGAMEIDYVRVYQ